ICRPDSLRGFHEPSQLLADALTGSRRIEAFERAQALAQPADGYPQIVYCFLISLRRRLPNLKCKSPQQRRRMGPHVFPKSQSGFLDHCIERPARQRCFSCLVRRGGPMSTETNDKNEQPKPKSFPRVAVHHAYPEPEPILDPTCIMEQVDRGEGMGVHDE